MAPWDLEPEVVVAKDGSGKFTSIEEGLAALPRKSKEPVVMYIKEGVYEEHITVEKDIKKLVLVGDGPLKTRITGNKNVAGMEGMTTSESATFAVLGSEFMAKDIGFENTAGPEGHQAVAFRSQSDKSVLFNCHFDGYQDTLYAQSKRQFYRDCTISGTIDFIFGHASAVFQNCKIVLRKPAANQFNAVTTHGREDKDEGSMFILHNCTITAEPDLDAAQNPSYLGRPWKPLAATVYVQCHIDGVIHPDGWKEWDNSPNHSHTCFYSEFDNRGPGADKEKRVSWPGIKELTLQEVADKYTVEKFFREVDWLKLAEVPVLEGMFPAGEKQ